MIEKLSNAGSEFEISRNEAEKASKTLKDITSLDEEIKKIIASESELDNIKKDVLSQNNTCRELSDKWNMLNQKFLNGQAAVLEKELKLKISEEGKAVCPVCHCEALAALAKKTAGRSQEEGKRDSGTCTGFVCRPFNGVCLRAGTGGTGGSG